MKKVIGLSTVLLLVLALAAVPASAQWGAAQWGAHAAQKDKHPKKDKCPKGSRQKDYCEDSDR